MPDEELLKRVEKDKEEGKSPSTQAGEFVREEIHLHDDPTFREEIIRNYLRRQLDADAAEAFEVHYLACDACFEELRVAGLLMEGLCKGRIELRRVADVLVLQFAGPAELTRQSFELSELQRALRQADTKVLIDLGRVVKIDSAGLGQLISHHSHVVKNQGRLKLLNPNAQVANLLRLTRIDSSPRNLQ